MGSPSCASLLLVLTLALSSPAAQVLTFASSRPIMGDFATGPGLSALCWAIAGLVMTINGAAVYEVRPHMGAARLSSKVRDSTAQHSTGRRGAARRGSRAQHGPIAQHTAAQHGPAAVGLSALRRQSLSEPCGPPPTRPDPTPPARQVAHSVVVSGPWRAGVALALAVSAYLGLIGWLVLGPHSQLAAAMGWGEEARARAAGRCCGGGGACGGGCACTRRAAAGAGEGAGKGAPAPGEGHVGLAAKSAAGLARAAPAGGLAGGEAAAALRQPLLGGEAGIGDGAVE
jgi:hypothetical protein